MPQVHIPFHTRTPLSRSLCRETTRGREDVQRGEERHWITPCRLSRSLSVCLSLACHSRFITLHPLLPPFATAHSTHHPPTPTHSPFPPMPMGTHRPVHGPILAILLTKFKFSVLNLPIVRRALPCVASRFIQIRREIGRSRETSKCF